MAPGRAWFGLAGGVAVVALAQGFSGCGSGLPPIPLEAPDKPVGQLSFPPPNEGWADRVPLEGAQGGFWAPSSDLHVRSPELDAKKQFEITGQVVELEFDDEAGDPKDAKPPVFKLTPPVPGRTAWTGKSTLQFRADQPFDEATEYTMELPEFTTPGGKKLQGGFKGTFKAKPVVEIAGKTIHYVPKPGVPRVVWVRPGEDRAIGQYEEMIVIFDQPIELGAAQPLLSMVDGKERKLGLALRHPAGSTFEGIKVDPRVIVLARMTSPPRPGTALTFSAKGKGQGDEATVRKFGIPELPKYQGMSCDECEVKGNFARGPTSNWGVGFSFSNSLGWHDMKRFVQITPRPPNFAASGQGETLGVHGSWAPGTTYSIVVSGATDRYGFALPSVNATFQALPRSANTVLRDGVVLIDEAHARSFFVTTRNVKKGILHLWPVAPGEDSLVEALKKSRAGETPAGDPVVVPFDGNPTPNVYVETRIDLSKRLEAGRAYIATAFTKEGAYGAPIATQGGYSSRSTAPSTPLIFVAGKDSVGAHVHWVGAKAIAQVYRLGSGEPVAGASLSLGAARGTTDAMGAGLLDVGTRKRTDEDILVIKEGAALTLLPFNERTRVNASALYPELAGGQGEEPEASGDFGTVGFVLTDKGIYRPGGVIRAKGILRRNDGKSVVPVKGAEVRLHVTNPSGTDVTDERIVTNDMGAVAREIQLAARAPTGQYHVRLESDAPGRRAVYYDETVRVAEFETPRFKVDVEGRESAPDRLKSRVVGRYFFGAPMSGGEVRWSLRKRPAPVQSGALGEAGLVFDEASQEYDEWGSPPPRSELKPFTGEGKLGADGGLDLDMALGPLGRGPTLVTLEADVADSSYRHVANRLESVKHPHTHYAGIKLDRQWGELGALKVSLGVVDLAGKAAPGKKVEARLDRLEWKRTAGRAESGSVLETWRSVPTPAGTCEVTSDAGPRPCELDVRSGGSYRVTARVDGHDDGSVAFYAYGGASSAAVPGAGKKIPLLTDKKSYRPGETAKVLVLNPFAEATAILAIQQGVLLKHEIRRVKSGATLFEVPLTIANAPYSHAEVTLLPVGGQQAGYRVGAVRIPVGLDDSRLTVSVVSARKMYDAGADVDVTVEVKHGNDPVPNADLTLAIVDEAILRLTNHHAKDPTSALHPPRPLEFMSADSRELLFRRRERAHVAGDGGGERADTVDTRKEFVETLAWLPGLVTDAKGRATARVRLKDNLTEFRMMATVIDGVGGAGVAENSFVVARPFLLDPILPQFALKGDRMEIGAMAHNNTDAPVTARVKILDQTRDVPLGPHGRAKVVVPFVAESSRKLGFSLEIDGKVRDRVERTLPVQAPGSQEHPMLSGVFRELQLIELAIPEDAIFEDDARLVLKTGSELYPELGQRLSYLLDYPHGCVEQTTSGTLPLLAAHVLLPWTGTQPLPDEELKKRIRAGVSRLASMKTDSGGLAYWPGGSEPHVYGTVYATRALLRASEMGIKEEKLLPGIFEFLKDRLQKERDPVIKVSIAEVLAQGGKLPESSADSLYDTREKLDSFGLASLALALSTLPKQAERVAGLLDMLETSFEPREAAKFAHGKNDYHYWGSSDRDRAQALIALSRLRKSSRHVPRLAKELSQRIESYATHSASWSLMAFADYVGKNTPSGKVDVSVILPGILFDVSKGLGGDNKEASIPLKLLRGKKVILRLEGDRTIPSAFSMEARYTRPYSLSPRHARREAKGPSIHRVYTDPFGKPVDVSRLKAGQIVRVALRAELAGVVDWRQRYLALTDRFPAGFEPVNPDLATVAQSPEIRKDHPFYEGLTQGGYSSASHVDVRADRVNIYFDHVYGHSVVFATYLLRATTPGEFVLPCAKGELMYESGSEGYSESGKVIVQP